MKMYLVGILKNQNLLALETSEVENLIDYIKEPYLNTQAAILIKGNNIIAEYYADGYDENDLVTSWSVAKVFLQH